MPKLPMITPLPIARVTEPGSRPGGAGGVPSGATRPLTPEPPGTTDATGARADALRVLAEALVAMR